MNPPFVRIPHLRRNEDRHNLMAPGTYTPSTIAVDDLDEFTATNFRRQFTAYRRQIRAGYTDPISHLLVLDLLLQTEPPCYVRARRVANMLSDARPDYHWAAQTVGRILTEIFATAIDNLPVGDESLITARDWRSAYWTYAPTAVTYEVLFAMRRWIATVATPYRVDYSRPNPTLVWADFTMDRIPTGVVNDEG